MSARPICFPLLTQAIDFAFSLALAKAGKSKPPRMLMMAITTRSSIRVNAQTPWPSPSGALRRTGFVIFIVDFPSCRIIGGPLTGEAQLSSGRGQRAAIQPVGRDGRCLSHIVIDIPFHVFRAAAKTADQASAIVSNGDILIGVIRRVIEQEWISFVGFLHEDAVHAEKVLLESNPPIPRLARIGANKPGGGRAPNITRGNRVAGQVARLEQHRVSIL